MTLFSIVLTAHVIIAALMVGLILIQHGKGADAGAAFGSGASGTVFGAKGSSSFLSRSTAILAACFFVTSLALAYIGANRASAVDIIDNMPLAQEATLENASPEDLINAIANENESVLERKSQDIPVPE